MKLTGKCKIDYLKWYKDVYSKENDIHEDGMSINYMPFSMAYGVYVDFFDSVGIEIILEYFFFNSLNIRIEEDNMKKDYHKQHFIKLESTRQEARVKAIEKANEIYNER